MKKFKHKNEYAIIGHIFEKKKHNKSMMMKNTINPFLTLNLHVNYRLHFSLFTVIIIFGSLPHTICSNRITSSAHIMQFFLIC